MSKTKIRRRRNTKQQKKENNLARLQMREKENSNYHRRRRGLAGVFIKRLLCNTAEHIKVRKEKKEKIEE